jgi:hypothetical protein
VVEAWSAGWEEIPHSPDCSDYPAWRWVGEPPEYDEDTPYEEYCHTVELCDATCDDFKEAVYTDVRARIGCPPEMD